MKIRPANIKLWYFVGEDNDVGDKTGDLNTKAYSAKITT